MASSRYLQTSNKLLQRSAAVTKPTFKSSLSLERPREISKLFNNPYNNYKCIHVAGTNGKGSVSTKIASILKECGFKTGLTTSPHISCLRERIQINNEMISENDFCNEIDEIINYEQLNDYNELSFFELITILSFNYFANNNVDYAVIEVGLGGKYDATNIITNPILSVITSISLDHTRILGETVDAIAMEKAGIIKPNTPVCIGQNVPKHVILNAMNDNNYDTNLLNVVEMNNDIQYTFDDENSLIAEKCIDIISKYDNSLNISLENLKKTKLNCYKNALYTKPKCRFEIIEYKSIECIMDGAHNLNGIQELIKSLLLKFECESYDYRFIVGMSKGKNIDLCLKVINEYAKYIHFVSISDVNKRSFTINELKECYYCDIESNDNKLIDTNLDDDCNEVIEYAVNQCVLNNENKQNKKQILIVCGSLYIMSNARHVFGLNDTIDPVNLSGIEFSTTKQM